MDETKERVSRKYLGKAGIHGVGIRRSRNALAIYVDTSPDPDRERIMKEIEKDAAPYEVSKFEGERATTT